MKPVELPSVLHMYQSHKFLWSSAEKNLLWNILCCKSLQPCFLESWWYIGKLEICRSVWTTTTQLQLFHMYQICIFLSSANDYFGVEYIKSSYQQIQLPGFQRGVTQFTYQHNAHMSPFGFHVIWLYIRRI
jgi:hypothetical protein